MTQNEKNHICEGLLIFAAATERLMQEYLNMEHIKLNGKSKMLHNGMLDSIKRARYYYEQLTEAAMVVLAESDRDFKRVEDLQLDADYMIRLFMRVINCNANKIANGTIEEYLQKMSENTSEVSETVINRFRIYANN